MALRYVEWQLDAGVLHVRLNRPDRLNALSEEVYADLHDALDVADDPDARVLLVSGAGRAFCAGADLKAHASRPRSDDERRAYVWTGQALYRRLRSLVQPVVVAVHGHAVGAGAELALCGDIVVAAESATFRLPEIELGSFVGGGVTQRLGQLVGAQHAAALLLLGRSINGTQAAAWGLVMEAIAETELHDRATDIARTLASRPREPLRRAVDALRRGHTLSLDDALALEADALLAQMSTGDWRDGVARFRGKAG